MPRKNIGVKSALKPSYSELLAVNTALKEENAKLHKYIVKLEAQKLSADNRIFALEEHFKEVEHYSAPSLIETEKLDRLASALTEALVIKQKEEIKS